MNPKLSIIIPFYNVEKYINECLESVYNQDIPEDEYEIICVNDCSPDHSRDIVLQYQQKHSNLILIEHEKNKMLGAARNTGLKAAKGEYIWFIDSDDYIETNVFSHLIQLLEKNDLEILAFNCKKVSGVQIEYFLSYFDFNKVTTGKEYLLDQRMPYWEKHVPAWSKIYKKSFLLVNDIFFPKTVFYEDNLQTLKSLLVCTRFKYIPDFIYFYRINPDSTVNSDDLIGRKIGDRLIACYQCIETLELTPLLKNEKSSLIETYVYIFEKSKKKIFYLPYTEKRNFWAEAKTINYDFLKKYLTHKTLFYYQHFRLFMVISVFAMPFIRFIKEVKRRK